MDFQVYCDCGECFTVSETEAGMSRRCSCGRMVAIPSFGKLRAQEGSPQGSFSNRETAPPEVRKEAANLRSAPSAPWLPWLWIGGGVYFLVRFGWSPGVAIFSVGAGIAIGIGVVQWLVDRCEVFRPWRVALRYVLLVICIVVLGAVLVGDLARQPAPDGPGAPDPKNDIVGTWQRKHEDKVVEQLTLSADGKYETFNPETGGTRESGTYSISADGKYRNMRPTDGPNYKCRIQFKDQDAFDDSQELGHTRLEFAYERKR